MPDPVPAAGTHARDPSRLSGMHAELAVEWRTIKALQGGLKALRDGGRDYLLPFPVEDGRAYAARLDAAKSTDVFGDVLDNLSQQPVSKPVTLEADGAPEDMVSLSEDVDGEGNHLHVTAVAMMKAGIAYGIDYLYIDYTPGLPAGASVADARAFGARPLWRRISATDMLCVRHATIAGRKAVVHVRWREDRIEVDGFDETTVEQVRVIDRPLEIGPDGTELYGAPVSSIWEKLDAGWTELDPEPVGLDIIPLVEFSAGDYVDGAVVPPLRRVADGQVDLYRQESALSYAAILTAFPMLVAEGLSPPADGEVLVLGPQTVLYAPVGDGENMPAPTYRYLEPQGQSLAFLQSRITESIRELRELGRQPLTGQSGNLTVATSTQASSKANAAVLMWALRLVDVLEQAFALSARRSGNTAWEPKVRLQLDLSLAALSGEGFDDVLALYQADVISRETLIAEAKRRGVLDGEYDADDDLEAILKEMDAFTKDDPDDLDEMPPPDGDDVPSPLTPEPDGSPPAQEGA